MKYMVLILFFLGQSHVADATKNPPCYLRMSLRTGLLAFVGLGATFTAVKWSYDEVALVDSVTSRLPDIYDQPSATLKPNHILRFANSTIAGEDNRFHLSQIHRALLTYAQSHPEMKKDVVLLQKMSPSYLAEESRVERARALGPPLARYLAAQIRNDPKLRLYTVVNKLKRTGALLEGASLSPFHADLLYEGPGTTWTDNEPPNQTIHTVIAGYVRQFINGDRNKAAMIWKAVYFNGFSNEDKAQREDVDSDMVNALTSPNWPGDTDAEMTLQNTFEEGLFQKIGELVRDRNYTVDKAIHSLIVPPPNLETESKK